MIYSVTVKPNSKHEKVEINGKNITIWCNAKPVDGEANAAVIKILSKHLKTPKTSIKILRGATSKHKLIEI